MALKMLEPDNGKLLCPVLRGLDGGNVILATWQAVLKDEQKNG